MSSRFKENVYHSIALRAWDKALKKYKDNNKEIYEVYARNVISRSYYTAFLYCRDRIREHCPNADSILNNNQFRIHSIIPKFFREDIITSQSIRENLERLHLMRKKADYETDIDILDKPTISQGKTYFFVDPFLALEFLQEILEEFKTDYINCNPVIED